MRWPPLNDEPPTKQENPDEFAQVEGQDGGASFDAVSGAGEKMVGEQGFFRRDGRVSRGAGFTPWTPPAKPVSECKVALVTTGGVHLKTQAPFDMENPDGDPTFREIPGDAARDALTITHDYYDHRGADVDLNVVFPHERLAEMAAEGAIGGVSPVHVSFMGHIDKELVERLVEETAPAAARRLREAGAEVALLAPA